MRWRINLIVRYLRSIFLMGPTCFLRYVGRVIQNKPRTLLFYPTYPHLENYSIRQTCKILGYRMTINPKDKHAAALHWQDATFSEFDQTLEEINKKTRVINFNCRDISKVKVDKVFHEVFGYSSLVDPLTHQGTCVRKSNINAKHDGKIIECPIREKDEECVYQIVVDNRFTDEKVIDFRVPLVDGTIPFVYLRFAPIEDRFGCAEKSILQDVNENFSKKEVSKILNFTKKMGLDFGELDILRDYPTGKMYILDVNNTCFNRFLGIAKRDKKKVTLRLAKSFEEVFIN